ncbi:hypothetical protein HMPREF3203_02622 [Proteus mirabilis]|nr:hypothetical protein HMPREF3203_02622 [Proteus mirabilis]
MLRRYALSFKAIQIARKARPSADKLLNKALCFAKFFQFMPSI